MSQLSTLGDRTVAEATGRRTAWAALATLVVLLGLAGVFLRALCIGADVDPDMFHEMSLAREALARGWIPVEDLFAYTPTVYPVVHHEWGAGVLFYAVVRLGGAAGLVALRYALTLGVLGLIVWTARRRGARWPVLAVMLPAVSLLLGVGFTTVRAQFLTLLLTAALLAMLELDRAGRRGWLLLWPVLHVAWLNVHAGFVAGLGVLVCEGLERGWRERRIPWRLVALLAVLGPLVLVNPYGTAYVTYLGRALPMDRPFIVEWAPIWTISFLAWPYLLSLLVLVYAVVRLGPRQTPGLLLMLVTACLALRHARHASLYAEVWGCCVPAWISQTPLAATLEGLWQRRRLVVAAVFAIVGGACALRALPDRPWLAHLAVEAQDLRDSRATLYPLGPAAYLAEHLAPGTSAVKVLAPFEVSAFLNWQLGPRVRVAVDGRYEVAYPIPSANACASFFDAPPEWRDTLERFPPDLVLVRAGTSISTAMGGLEGWHIVYRDDLWTLHARVGFDLPPVERQGRGGNVGPFP